MTRHSIPSEAFPCSCRDSARPAPARSRSRAWSFAAAVLAGAVAASGAAFAANPPGTPAPSNPAKPPAAQPPTAKPQPAPTPATAGTPAPAAADAPVPPPQPAKPAPVKPAAPSSGPAPFLEKGTLKNGAHGFQFPVPKGWALKGGATADEMLFTVPSCDECMLRVLVSTGNTDTLKATVQEIRDHIAEDPTATKLGEEPIQVAKEEAYTLVKEETLTPAAAPADAKAPNPAGKRVKTRYVTFNHAGTKYYLLLRAPSDRFPSDDSAFESLLAKFHFS